MRRFSYLKCLLLGVSLLFAFSFWPSSSTDRDRYFDTIKSLDIFSSLFKELNTYYVDDVAPLQLLEQAVLSMLQHLDPYTVYISEEDISDYRLQHTEGYVSVGLQVAKRAEGYFIRSISPGSAAATDTKVRIGDLLLSINSLSLEKRSIEDVRELLHGQSNTEVSLELRHPKSSSSYVRQLRRLESKRSSIAHQQLLPGTEIGYVQLSEFSKAASRSLQRSLRSLMEAGATAFVLDLRDNGGGLLHEAVAISNFFVPRGSEVVHARGRHQQWSKTYYAEQEPLDMERPLLVLVNRRTASASEIVAGVVQDYDRGLILGEKTFGKGLVQTTVPLPYNGQLRVTTAHYYTPSGRCIQAINYSKQEQTTATTYDSSSWRTFYTKNKRVVYDRGGISPDISILHAERTPIVQHLMDQLLIFDYATEYSRTHTTLVDTASFLLSEEECDLFEKWLLAEPRSYETPAHKALLQLQERFEKEVRAGSLKEEFKVLKEAMQQVLRVGLQTHRSYLRYLLSTEIASRYRRDIRAPYSALSQDSYIQEAKKLLSDPTRYARLLGEK